MRTRGWFGDERLKGSRAAEPKPAAGRTDLVASGCGERKAELKLAAPQGRVPLAVILL